MRSIELDEIDPGLDKLFEELPTLEETAELKQGLLTGDNFRFLRFWWEVGKERIGNECVDLEEAQASGKRWFPFSMGEDARWCIGAQQRCVNWEGDGEEIKSLGLDSKKASSRHRNADLYFLEGVTCSLHSGGRINASISPKGFIFGGSSLFVFTDGYKIPLVMALLNSRLARLALDPKDPKEIFKIADLKRLPIPNDSSPALDEVVGRAISILGRTRREAETSLDFVAPFWTVSPDDTETELFIRRDAYDDIERDIEAELFSFYGISESDPGAFEPILSAERSYDREYPDEEEISLAWISYAVGIVMGRFSPGVPGALGQGRFDRAVAKRLRALAIDDGIATLDEGSGSDLASKVWMALGIALGKPMAKEVVEVGLDKEGDHLMLLRSYLKNEFWRHHLKRYRKRPVYWLLQSPMKNFSVYVHHHQATKDTLGKILGNKYLGRAGEGIKKREAEIRKEMMSTKGKAKRLLEEDLAIQRLLMVDLIQFRMVLQKIIDQVDEEGKAAGFVPEIDDGVILNLAPLHELIPAWKEPQKYWQALEAGEYDWSKTAMRYWPRRVAEKCRTNKSIALAQGRMDLYEGAG